MEVEVTVLTRRGSAMMRRSRRLSARRLRFGRGTGNEVPLPDIRVDLNAAALFPLNGRLSIRAVGPSPIRVNGQSTTSASVGPGDEVLIGPYRIEFTEPPAGCDAALSVELVQPLGDALDRLMSQAQVGLHHAAISKRKAAWIGFALVAVICLMAPIALYLLGHIPSWHETAHERFAAAPFAFLWQPGQQSNPHRFFAANCTTCHSSAFTRVKDEACLGCHTRPAPNVERISRTGELREALASLRCTDCHEEHRGIRGTIIAESRLCAGCHASVAEKAPAADVPNVSGFPKGHPEFRITLVADPAGPQLKRVALGGTPPTDHPGIKFSHAAHLVPQGFPALGYKPMNCADCHIRDAGGEGFQPIAYKDQCQSCHALKFERQDLPWPGGTVQHGDDTGVVAAVWNFYAGKALQAGIAAPEPPATPRRAAGAPAAVSSSGDGSALAWVADKTETALRTIVFDEKRGCAYCHFGTGPQGSFDLSHILPAGAKTPDQQPGRIIAPVAIQSRFFPHARFDHSKHAAMDCGQCHDARHAETSSVVLIPGAENCAQCHGAEKAASRTESSCITCHRFHHDLLGEKPAARAALE